MLGMYERLYKSARGSRIIIYHGVCKKNSTRFNTLFVTKKTFEAHLLFYKKYFHIISLADFYNGNFNNDRFNICLSFDDGFANNYKYVLPLLEKHKIPATFFVTAIRKEGYDILWNDFLTLSSVKVPEKIVVEQEVFYKSNSNTYISSATRKTLSVTLRQVGFEGKRKMMTLLRPYASFWQDNDLSDYWLQMTIDEIKKASASPFVTIGSHGYWHNDLAKIAIPEMAEELRQSKAFLESITNKTITGIAFPYGSYSENVVEESLKAGYKQLLAAEFLYQDDKNNMLIKERMGINPFVSIRNQMYAIIKGNYE